MQNRLKIRMTGGRQGAFISAVQRNALRLGNDFELGGGACSGKPAVFQAGAGHRCLAPEMVYNCYHAHFETAKLAMESDFHLIDKPATFPSAQAGGSWFLSGILCSTNTQLRKATVAKPQLTWRAALDFKLGAPYRIINTVSTETNRPNQG